MGAWVFTMLLGITSVLAAEEPVAAEEGERAGDDGIVSLSAYNVAADRIEDFGLRVSSDATRTGRHPTTMIGIMTSKFAPRITAILPNTAADRSDLRPGEFILKSEGKSTVGGMFSTGKFGQWSKTQKKKWKEVAAGKTDVTWTLEVEDPATKAVRTVKLVVPTPPPHWGSSMWRAPHGRSPATVEETGPLAERSRAVLDHGIWTLIDPYTAEALGWEASLGFEPTGYEWRVATRTLRKIVVTQFRGRTDVILETSSWKTGRQVYLTSPSGVLERAWNWQRRGPKGAMSLDDARAGFEAELDFWTDKMVAGTGRWPFEVAEGYDAEAVFATIAARQKGEAPEAPRPLSGEFLKLRGATETEHALFTEAYGKLGADSDQWAYTEMLRGLEDKRVLVTRVDPSQPEGERCMLLSIDGKAPTPAEVQEWRDDGGDTLKPLGDILPLAGIVDLKDPRVFKDEATSVVFELPIRNDNADFPGEKFQALFRVNKASRAFEAVEVKLRDTFRVAGMVKVTDAGLEMCFATFDPTLAPQPVRLKMGGGVRVLFLKFARSLEVTRADFRRVHPP